MPLFWCVSGRSVFGDETDDEEAKDSKPSFEREEYEEVNMFIVGFGFSGDGKRG